MVSVSGLDTRFRVRLDHIAGATIWPAMIGWLGISGVGILWKLRLITGMRPLIACSNHCQDLLLRLVFGWRRVYRRSHPSHLGAGETHN